MEGGDGVVDLLVSHQLDLFPLVYDEAEEETLPLHEGLAEAVKLDLAGRLDCGDFVSLRVEDNPIFFIPILAQTTQNAQLITADLTEDWVLSRL